MLPADIISWNKLVCGYLSVEFQMIIKTPSQYGRYLPLDLEPLSLSLCVVVLSSLYSTRAPINVWFTTFYKSIKVTSHTPVLTPVWKAIVFHEFIYHFRNILIYFWYEGDNSNFLAKFLCIFWDMRMLFIIFSNGITHEILLVFYILDFYDSRHKFYLHFCWNKLLKNFKYDVNESRNYSYMYAWLSILQDRGLHAGTLVGGRRGYNIWPDVVARSGGPIKLYTRPINEFEVSR